MSARADRDQQTAAERDRETARPRWIDGEMEEPWFRDLVAGTTASHAADLTGWAERVAKVYSKSGTLEITAVVWALLDRIDALAAERARVETAVREIADTYAFLGATLHDVPRAETYAEVATELRAALDGLR